MTEHRKDAEHSKSAEHRQDAEHRRTVEEPETESVETETAEEYPKDHHTNLFERLRKARAGEHEYPAAAPEPYESVHIETRQDR